MSSIHPKAFAASEATAKVVTLELTRDEAAWVAKKLLHRSRVLLRGARGPKREQVLKASWHSRKQARELDCVFGLEMEAFLWGVGEGP